MMLGVAGDSPAEGVGRNEVGAQGETSPSLLLFKLRFPCCKLNELLVCSVIVSHALVEFGNFFHFVGGKFKV